MKSQRKEYRYTVKEVKKLGREDEAVGYLTVIVSEKIRNGPCLSECLQLLGCKIIRRRRSTGGACNQVLVSFTSAGLVAFKKRNESKRFNGEREKERRALDVKCTATRCIALCVARSGKERWDNGVVTARQWRGHGTVASRCPLPPPATRGKKFREFFPYPHALSVSLFRSRLHLRRLYTRARKGNPSLSSYHPLLSFSPILLSYPSAPFRCPGSASNSLRHVASIKFI